MLMLIQHKQENYDDPAANFITDYDEVFNDDDVSTQTDLVKLISVTPDAEKHITYCVRVSNPNNQENEKFAGLSDIVSSINIGVS